MQVKQAHWQGISFTHPLRAACRHLGLAAKLLLLLH
jgi:hypothetical protein